ncbi:MAG: toprim domain-containing protein [Candidatus Omnitrophica bacterium]|nr:toprim domain-containing protein [Candidatus Omnitrophota bacterium]
MTLTNNILSIPVKKVVEALGLETTERGGKLWIRCPFTHHEHDDTNPACEVGGKKNLVKCFKCNIAKDNLGLVMQVKDLEAKDAANWLRSEFGMGGPEDKNIKPINPINMLANLRGWSVHAFDLLDCKNEKDYVSIPMRDDSGEVVGVKRRKGNNKAFKWYGKPVKSYTPRNNKHGLFYPKEGITEEDPLLIVEGEADVLAALSTGYHNVIGTAGTNPGSIGEASLQAMVSSRKVVLFPDPDAAGRKWLGDISEMLLNTQCEVYYVPAGKTDLDNKLRYQKDKRKAMTELLETKKKYIPKDPSKKYNLPEIYINDHIVDSLVRQSLDALVKKNDPPSIFVRGNTLVRVLRDDNDNITIEPWVKSNLRFRISECARYVWLASNGDEYFKKPPDDVVEAVLTLGNWPFPPLQGVTGAPILRDDGSICTEPGYDEHTAIYYSPSDDFSMPEIPEIPSQEELLNAKALLLDVIADFPFSDEAGPANIMAFLFTMLMRNVIDGYVPLCLVDAPTQGTGKGKLVKNLSIIALGDELSSQSAPHGRYAEEEWRKLLLSILHQGSPAVLFDNISEKEVLDSAPLAAIITSGNYAGRILGQTNNPTYKVSISWVATGNNIKVTGDMPRRCYTVRLDSNLERPWERSPDTFKHPNLERYVRENRIKLLRAAFIIIRSWYAAGKPPPKDIPVVGSFIEWSEIIGGVLQHAGIEGFLSNQEKLRDQQDDEGLQWQAFFNVWYQTWGSSGVSTAEICSQIMTDGTDISEVVPDVLLYSKEKGEASLKRSLGRRLSSMSGKIYNNLKIHYSTDGHLKKKRWCLVEANEDSAVFAVLSESKAVLSNQKTPPTDSTKNPLSPPDIVDVDSLRYLRYYGCIAIRGNKSLFDDESKKIFFPDAAGNNTANSLNTAKTPQKPELEKNNSLTPNTSNTANTANTAKGKSGEQEEEEFPEIKLGPALDTSNTANTAGKSEEKEEKDKKQK